MLCSQEEAGERERALRVEDEAGECSGVLEKSKREEARARRTLEKGQRTWMEGRRLRGRTEHKARAERHRTG